MGCRAEDATKITYHSSAANLVITPDASRKQGGNPVLGVMLSPSIIPNVIVTTLENPGVNKSLHVLAI